MNTMTKYKKTTIEPCPACDGKRRVKNRMGASIMCKGCSGTGKQKTVVIIEEVPDEYS